MILVTGATGTVGRALVPKLLERGDEVRVLVRDPRKLGRMRVEVRIALGDLVELGDPRVVRGALRGVTTVIHLAAAIRDQPIWAEDVARSVVADLGEGAGSRRHELAGPDLLTYDEIARLIASAAGRERPLVHVPLGLVHYGLAGLRRLVGDAAFATWEEAELMEVAMVSDRGHADVRALGVEPRPMAEVLGAV